MRPSGMRESASEKGIGMAESYRGDAENDSEKRWENHKSKTVDACEV